MEQLNTIVKQLFVYAVFAFPLLLVGTVNAQDTQENDVIEVANIQALLDDDQEGEVYQITGEVIVTYIDRDSRNQHYIADETGAFLIDDADEVLGEEFSIGDGMVDLTAEFTSFGATRQLVPEENPGVNSEDNELPVFGINLEDFNTDDHQSMLIELEEAEFLDEGVFEGSSNYDVIDLTIEEEDAAVFTTFEFTDALDYLGDPIVQGPISLRGIVTEFQGNPQLTARTTEDFIFDIGEFALIAPEDGAQIEIEGDLDTEHNIQWETAEADVEVSYTWHFDAEDGDFSEPLVSISAGADTELTLTNAQLYEALAEIEDNLEAGDDVSGIWTVTAEAGSKTQFADTEFDITFQIGELTPEIGEFALLNPEDGANVTVEGSSNTELEISWETAETDIQPEYTWYLNDEANFDGEVIASFSSDGEGMDTTLTLTYDDIDALLDGEGYDIGETANLHWTVKATAFDSEQYANEPFALDLERGDVFDPIIEFANIQWPFETEVASGDTTFVYGRVYAPNFTEGNEEVEQLQAWVGVSQEEGDPAEWEEAEWHEMWFNQEASDAIYDEYEGPLTGLNPGEHNYVIRYQLNGEDYVYGGISDQEDQLGLDDDTRGGIWDGDDNVSGVLTVTPVEVGNIAELLHVGQIGSGIVYTVSNEVYLVFNSEFRNRKVAVDPTGGIVFDDSDENLSTDFNRYDGLTGITGSLGEFNGLIQFQPVEDIEEVSSSNNQIFPRRLALADVDSMHQGELVMIEDVTFQETGEFENGVNYTIEDGEGNELTMRTDRIEESILDEGEESYIGTAIPQDPVTLIGYIGMFFDPQLTVRKLDDIIDPTVLGDFNLQFPENEDTLVVEGAGMEEIPILWEDSESEADVTYQWMIQMDGLNYTPPHLTFPGDNDGVESQVTLTREMLDEALQGVGLEEGEMITLNWTVMASEADGNARRYAHEDFTVTLERGVVNTSEIERDVPEQVTLNQNYPNPFNPITTIEFQLPSTTDVQLTVYNTLGQQVATLVNEQIQAGSHEVSFDGSNLASGVYIYRLQADGQVITNQMTLVK